MQLDGDVEPVEARHVLGQRGAAGAAVDDAGNADHRSVDRARAELRRREQRALELAGGFEQLADVGTAHLDVLARSQRSAQVADSAAQEARAHVEPEHKRGLGHRFEEGGAVARAVVAAVLRLAHEAGVEQRAKRRGHRGLGDAHAPGDLGTRHRRVGADGLEHGALVHPPEQGRRGGCARGGHCVPSRSPLVGSNT